MEHTTLTLELIGDTAEERVEFTTRTYMCTADRIAWERHFGEPIGRLAAESKDIVDDEIPEGMREEWVAFFCWRAARRALPDRFGSVDFTAFVDQLAGIEIDERKEEQGEQEEQDRPSLAAAAG